MITFRALCCSAALNLWNLIFLSELDKEGSPPLTYSSVFINDSLDELCASNFGLPINEINLTCPTDDILL